MKFEIVCLFYCLYEMNVNRNDGLAKMLRFLVEQKEAS